MEYKAIHKKYNLVCQIKQINYYFETKDQYFKNSNSALRVRIIDDSIELTLKIKTSDGSIEHNFIIEDSIFNDMMSAFTVPNQLLDLIHDDIIIDQIIKIETTRSVISFRDYKVEVDLTNFGTTIDYEIEVEAETMCKAQEILDIFLSDNDIVFTNSSPKIARYFKYN